MIVPKEAIFTLAKSTLYFSNFSIYSIFFEIKEILDLPYKKNRD